MSLRSGTQKYGVSEDDFVKISGYSRNLALEERLQREEDANRIYDTAFIGVGGGTRNPVRTPTPSWWDSSFGWRTNNEYTDNEALEYLNIALKYYVDKVEYRSYQCHNYPRDTSACQASSGHSGTVSNITRLIAQVKKQIADEAKINGNGFDIFPEAFAEEDPSIYQSDEVVTVTPGALTWYYVKKPSGICERLNVSQNFVNRMTSQGWIFSLTDICKTDVKCPARVRIINNETNQASGDGVFNCDTIEQYTEDPRYRVEYYDGVTPTPTPTPTTTTTPTTVHVSPPEETRCYMVHGQKLELSQQAVGYYINQGVTVTPCEAITDEIPPPSEVPTDFEYEDITTAHIPPPDMPVEEPPITVTPTEPSQVNWIPEPFFSFINNVFRR